MDGGYGISVGRLSKVGIHAGREGGGDFVVSCGLYKSVLIWVSEYVGTLRVGSMLVRCFSWVRIIGPTLGGCLSI
jgi:hypothetical protein